METLIILKKQFIQDFKHLREKIAFLGARECDCTIDLFKKGGALKCEEVRTFSHCITFKTITYHFSVGFVNVYRSRNAIFYFQDL